ncbi:hypothetical protein OROGR_006665 [Orobanche gracilis]
MSSNIFNVETEEYASGSLLELAANNDLYAFQKYINDGPSIVDEVGPWYGRQKGSSQMVRHHLTPLMVAATYGSLDVLEFIISLPNVDVNRSCGADKSTALHCAACGGSLQAVDIVKLLLAAGADPDLTDVNGRRPIDVIFVSPKSPGVKYTLQMLLATDNSFSNLNSAPLSPLRKNFCDGRSDDNGGPAPSAPEKKEYPVDPSLPDIKNSIYSTDEFRMFLFKVRPCSRAYSHDWTECPFVHPGENARRRDPRKYHYSCVPCPDFRKGACRRGDMCEYSHGVFECWLHPAQYRTRICKDGIGCNRRVCFFAHTQLEVRPLYVSTGSTVPSPRSNTSAVDFPFSPSSPFTPPMSPSANGVSSNRCWASQQNVPALHLPGSNSSYFQSSRLRSSLNARVQMQQDFSNRSVGPKTLHSASSLDDIFNSPEGLSPRFSDFSPTHKSAIHNQMQQQGTLSPIKTSFSPRNNDHSLLQGLFGVMPPHNMEPISPMSARMSNRPDNHHLDRFRSHSSRDLSSSATFSDETWSKWAPPPNGTAEWALTGDEFGKLKRSSSFEVLSDGEEPDLSWVQSLVKESPQEMKEKSAPRLAGNAARPTSSIEGTNPNNQIEDQSVLGAWVAQMQLDQMMAQ